jgi:hypothetical protein
MSLRPALALALLTLSTPARADYGNDDFGWTYGFPYYDDNVGAVYGDLEPDVCGGTGVLEFHLQAVRPNLDIILVVDSSGSIGLTTWEQVVRPKLVEFTSNLDFSHGRTRLGVVIFADTAKVRYSLGDSQQQASVDNVLRTLPSPGGWTNTSAGLAAAMQEFDAHDDPARAKVLVLVTDGIPNRPLNDASVCDTEPAALQSRDILPFLLGVGDNFSTTAVSCLLRDPADMYTPDDYASIDWQSAFRRFPGVSDLSLSLELSDLATYGGITADAGELVVDGSQVTWTIDQLSTTSVLEIRDAGAPAAGPGLYIPFHQDTTLGSGGATGLVEYGEVTYRDFGDTAVTSGTLDVDVMRVDLPTCVVAPVDTDGDGRVDGADAFPTDPAEWADSDLDRVGDNADICPGGDDAVDGDTDGSPDACDACPVDFYNDSDGDGSCDATDPCPLDPDDDADDDGVCGDEDFCPLDLDDDADADGICGDVDRCPADAANDADGDGICGNVDACAAGDDTLDGDGDGAADACDLCPADAANDADSDGACADVDPCPWDADDDGDGDGVCGDVDACPLDTYDDSDGDAVCDSSDPCPDDLENDADGDGFCESDDLCPAIADAAQSDVDGDGTGDACEPDNDGDGVIDDLDLCPLDGDAGQADADGDGIGDACDGDDDGDGVSDATDLCLGTAAGEPVLPDGCAIDQEVRCEAAWKNHGAYVSAVAKAATSLARSGTIGWEERDTLVSAAARSTCGSR